MFRAVLVPLNGTAAAEAAIPFAVDEAHRHGARLVLVRVFPRPELPADRIERGGPLPQTYVCSDTERNALHCEANEYFHSIAERFSLSNTTEYVISIGDPYLRLRTIAGRFTAPLVVVATKDPQSLRGSVLSEAAIHLLRCSGIPVMFVNGICPAPESDFGLSLWKSSEKRRDAPPEWIDIALVSDKYVIGVN